MSSIAVLLACFNRKTKTLSCLESLFSQISAISHEVDVYLLDDNSSDGTSEEVQAKFPQVKLFKGHGDFYWAGGMRKIWNIAKDNKPYDIFLLINDDIVLFPDALKRFMNTYFSLKRPGIILIGSMKDPDTEDHSYGGWNLVKKSNPKYTAVFPDENKILSCDLANANLMLVDKETVKRIGIFSDIFRHSIADYDYSFRGVKAGIHVAVAPGYYGYCKDDHGDSWLPQSSSLKERIKYLYSPKGLEYNEYGAYIKEHFPRHYLLEKSKLWLKTLFPFLWNQFKQSKQ